jgi:hypothetical protein
MLLTKKLERNKVKIERRIDNLKREYVNILNTLSKLDNQVLDMLPGVKVPPVVPAVKPIDIPVIPEDANLQQGE